MAKSKNSVSSGKSTHPLSAAITLGATSIFTDRNKPIVLGAIFLALLADILYVDGTSDFRIFGLLVIFLITSFFYKIGSRLIFYLCLGLLAIMYLSFLVSGTSAMTEKAAVWIFIFFAVGIIKQWQEINIRTNTSGRGIHKLKKIIAPLFCFNNWWIFYLDYFNMLGRRKLTYKLYNGVKFSAKAKDADGLIINEVWGSKIYTPSSFQIKNTDTVVDIGAHKGYFSVYAAKYAKKGSVHAFEPTEKNFEYLKKNLKLNNCINAYPYKLGVTGKKEKREIYEFGDQAGGISLIKEWFSDTNKVNSYEVTCISLGDIFPTCKIKKMNFLKLDCEGSEHEILLNASSETMRKIDKISMEYHEIGDLKVEKLISFLKKNKFFTRRVHQEGVIGMLYAQKSRF